MHVPALDGVLFLAVVFTLYVCGLYMVIHGNEITFSIVSVFELIKCAAHEKKVLCVMTTINGYQRIHTSWQIVKRYSMFCSRILSIFAHVMLLYIIHGIN